MQKVLSSPISQAQICARAGDAPLGPISPRGEIGERIAKGGAFPLLVESTPPVLIGVCVFLCSALGPVEFT